jgi:hypothetical protein
VAKSDAEFLRWHACGREWALLVDAGNSSAKFSHGLRKLELEFVYGVFETVFREKKLNLCDRLAGWRVLRGGAMVATLRAAIGRNFGSFLRDMHKAVAVALPLDMFFAIYGANKHWFSERHFWLLAAACALGAATAAVAAVVRHIEPHISVSADEPEVQRRCLALIAKHDERQCLELIEKRAKLAQLSTTVTLENDMMNKWFEVAWALLDEAHAAAFENFSMPLFWIKADEKLSGASHTLQLHTIDLNRVPFALRPLEIYR